MQTHLQSRRPDWLLEAVRAGAPLRVQHTARLRHNLINLTALTGTLSLGGLVLLAAVHLPWWLYIPLASLALGLVWFATFILVVHEASHGMFLRTADKRLQRRLNRIAGWLVCLPLTVHFDRHWLIGHHRHHRDPLTEHDPQDNVHQGGELLRTCLGLLLIPGYCVFVRFIKRRTRSDSSHTSPALIAAFPLIWLLVSALLTNTLTFSAAFALFHGVQVLMVLNEIKAALEHGGVADAQDPLLRSRTSLFFGRRLLMPWNISLHFEHHLDPQVPWYRLPTYHRALGRLLPAQARAAVFDAPLLERLTG